MLATKVDYVICNLLGPLEGLLTLRCQPPSEHSAAQDRQGAGPMGLGPRAALIH